jgi:hypothetical protein
VVVLNVNPFAPYMLCAIGMIVSLGDKDLVARIEPDTTA